MTSRLEKIKKVTLRKPYVYFFIFFFFLFIILNIFINKIYVTYPLLFDNLKLGIPIIFFNFLVAFLIAVNINLVIFKFKEVKELNKKGSGFTFLGVFGGFLGGACPGCFVGLFPAVLGLFGISATLIVLPLYGIEIQAASAIVLIISTFLLTRDNVCEINVNSSERRF